LAAARFLAVDIRSRDQALEGSKSVAVKMSPAQIAQAQQLEREWKPK
jgi:hypothetical protein